MTKREAFHAIAQLTSDSDRVNQAIAELLRRAHANGIKTGVVLEFLAHKFDHVIDGLADVVMSEDDGTPIVFTVTSGSDGGEA